MCDNEPLCAVLRTILNVFVKPWITVRVGVDTKKNVRKRCLKPRNGPQPPSSTAAQNTALLSRAEWPNLYFTMFVQRMASFVTSKVGGTTWHVMSAAVFRN